MSFLHAVGRWLCGFLAVALLGLWMGLMVLQMTLLNRQTVMGWLQQSGVYQNVFDAMPVDVGEGSGQTILTADEFKSAIAKTFPPAYIQQQVETVVDASYDWVEGKQSSIDFSLPIHEKQADFSTNVAEVITPKLAALPVCQSRLAPSGDVPTCLPQGVTAEQFAQQLTAFDSSLPQNAGFTQPVTPATIFGESKAPDMSWLPETVKLIGMLTIALPITAVLLGTGFVLLHESKLKGLGAISRRVFFYGLFGSLLGGAAWYFGDNFSLGSVIILDDMVQQAMFANLVDPIIRTIVPNIGQIMVVLAGSIALVGAGTWLASVMLQQRQERQPLHVGPTAQPQKQPDTPTPPPTTQPPSSRS